MKNTKKIYLFSTSSYPDTIHVNSLDTHFFTPEIDFSTYDHLIITSKQVATALQQYKQNSFTDKSALCVSNKTAKSFEAIGGEVLAIGDGYGDDLVDIIKHYPKEKRWLYLRAKEVASDFAQQLQADGYKIDEVIIYETFCSKDIYNVQVEDDAVLIFTSPSSIKCFLKNNTIKQTQKIVTIGDTTAKALPDGVKYKTASMQNIEACVELAKKLIDLK